MLRMLPVVSFEMGIDCEYNELGTKDGTFVLHHCFQEVLSWLFYLGRLCFNVCAFSHFNLPTPLTGFCPICLCSNIHLSNINTLTEYYKIFQNVILSSFQTV